MLYLSLCVIWIFLLILISMMSFMFTMYCIMNDLIYFIEWEITNINSCSIVMTILLNWMSLLFMSFVMLISSLLILYSNDYMKGDVTLNWFIFLF